jgi:hypothetical protein
MIRRNRDSLKRWCSVLGFVLHPGQQRVLDAFADGIRFLVVVCGRRWGKTLLAFIIAGYGLLEKDTRILVVSKTYRLASRVWSMLVPQVARVFGRQAKIFRGSLTIRTLWGSELVLGSADHPDSLLGEGYDLVIFDEAATCPRDIWQQFIRPALMDKVGSAVFITTPRGYNWIHELFLLGQDADFPEYWSIQAPSSSNPYLAPAELAEARRTTDPLVWQQEYEAEFVAFVGQVYSLFDRERHVLETVPPLEGWSISAAVDPGLANPTAILWIAHHPTTGEDIVIDEVVQSGLLFPDVLRLLNEHKPAGGYDLLVCDIAGRARSQETGASFIGWMKDHGLRFKAHSQGIVDGVNCVRSRFVDADGNVHLKIAARCVKTIEALQGYHYPEKDGEQSEEPEKDGTFDHPMDALRYYTTYRHARRPGRSWQT